MKQRNHFLKKARLAAALALSAALSANLCGLPAMAAPENARAPVSVRDQQIDRWFEGTVLVGDSIMQGFRSYAAQHGDSWMGQLQFLSSGNFSVYNGLMNVVQPMYLGRRTPVWDGLKAMGAKRVMICLGLNDINVSPLDTCVSLYEEFVGKITDANPGIDVSIISMTYTYPGVEKGRLYNPTIREYNGMLEELAAKHGWGYIDLADALSDGSGNLSPVYCSDEYVHHSPGAFPIWEEVLRDYAAERMHLGKAGHTLGQWVETENSGRKYRRPDGSFLADGWYWIDDNKDGVAECYYFYADGSLAFNARTPDHYYVNKDGQWEEDGKVRSERIAVF